MEILETTHIADKITEHVTEHVGGIHVPPLSAEQLGTFFGMPITNTLITSWIVVAILVVTAFFVGRSIKVVPGRLQLIVESMLIGVYEFMVEILENKKLARFFLPMIVTIFLFIVTSNVLEFTPGIGSIEFGGEPLFRSVNTDLNVTLALAIIAFITIEVTGIHQLGVLTYAKKFFNFKSVIGFMVGLIELMSELVRLVSFSFRLFGNIFAGEVLIAVVSYFVPYVLPSALMSFELFIGFVQAAIFALLTLLFIKLAVIEPH